MSYSDIKLDLTRKQRLGFDEAIFCSRKSVEQITKILDQILSAEKPLLLTHFSEQQYPHMCNETF